jgi:hypothetical protein
LKMYSYVLRVNASTIQRFNANSARDSQGNSPE